MIGIVGGIGPLAGVNLCKHIIRETKASKDQDHIPFLLESVPQNIPDRTAYILGEVNKNPGKPIAEALIRLAQSGATTGIIGCNTAHAPVIFDEVKTQLNRARVSLHLLHMIKESVDYIAGAGHHKKVGILSTYGGRQVGLYKNQLEKTGIEPVSLPKDLAKATHRAIYNPNDGIKTKSQCTPKAKSILYKSLDYLIEQGVSSIILGCTEIPICIQETRYRKTPIINPMQIVARKAIELYDKTKLKP